MGRSDLGDSFTYLEMRNIATSNNSGGSVGMAIYCTVNSTFYDLISSINGHAIGSTPFLITKSICSYYRIFGNGNALSPTAGVYLTDTIRGCIFSGCRFNTCQYGVLMTVGDASYNTFINTDITTATYGFHCGTGSYNLLINSRITDTTNRMNSRAVGLLMPSTTEFA
jgi:hypothetical protein